MSIRVFTFTGILICVTVYKYMKVILYNNIFVDVSYFGAIKLKEKNEKKIEVIFVKDYYCILRIRGHISVAAAVLTFQGNSDLDFTSGHS